MIISSVFLLYFLAAIALTLISLGLDHAAIVAKYHPVALKRVQLLVLTLLVLAIIGMATENFAGTLTLLVLGTGVISLIDRLFFHRTRKEKQRAQPAIVENAYSFFGVLLLVWVIRSFIVQPYRVPTGSLQPTVAPGDFLVVNQFAYGLKFPVTNNTLVSIGEPKRGDVILFYWPLNTNVVFVKRLIGLPGDQVEYRNKVLYINGKEMKQKLVDAHRMDDEPPLEGNPEEHIPVLLKEEDLGTIKHAIYMTPESARSADNFSITVPAGEYFMMGDNRDNSADSRSWGFVPEKNLIGKAFGIWMSWDALSSHIRWNRIGMSVKNP